MSKQENGGRWLKLTFRCPAALAEAAGDLLAVLSGSGVEQSPETGGFCVVSGFFALEGDEDAGRIKRETAGRLAELFALYGEPAPEPRAETLADEDWATSWRQYFKPFAVAEGLIIKPGWEDYAPKPGELVLEMDPGMAFGTGQHASTRLALGLMRQAMRENAPNRVLDVGTGTGILAMAAALWGAETALAIDNDPVAVRVAGENAAKNGLAGRVVAAETPLAEVEGAYGLVCANIVHDVLVAMLPDFRRLVAPGGRLVLAGILSGEQEANIARLYGESGFVLEATVYEDEWAALLFKNGATRG